MALHHLASLTIGVPNTCITSRGRPTTSTRSGHRRQHARRPSRAVRVGLGRHHGGSNFFWYLKDPAGNFFEYYSDLDTIPDDHLWKPEVLEGDKGLFNWGPPPPPSFIRPEDLGALMAGTHTAGRWGSGPPRCICRPTASAPCEGPRLRPDQSCACRSSAARPPQRLLPQHMIELERRRDLTRSGAAGVIRCEHVLEKSDHGVGVGQLRRLLGLDPLESGVPTTARCLSSPAIAVTGGTRRHRSTGSAGMPRRHRQAAAPPRRRSPPDCARNRWTCGRAGGRRGRGGGRPRCGCLRGRRSRSRKRCRG
jgi:hypothetical protein